jgi:hypothetical protein
MKVKTYSDEPHLSNDDGLGYINAVSLHTHVRASRLWGPKLEPRAYLPLAPNSFLHCTILIRMS